MEESQFVYTNAINPRQNFGKKLQLSDDIAFRFSNKSWEDGLLLLINMHLAADAVSGEDIVNLLWITKHLVNTRRNIRASLIS